MREGLWIVKADSICFVVGCFEHPFPDVLHGSHAFQGISIGIGLTGALVLLGCLSKNYYLCFFQPRGRGVEERKEEKPCI